MQPCQLIPHVAHTAVLVTTPSLQSLVGSPPKGAETIESSKEPHNPMRQMHCSRFVRLDDWFLCFLLRVVKAWVGKSHAQYVSTETIAQCHVIAVSSTHGTEA